jgi:sugar O-acyltransferase (sialic acid O-acetyltransferase NeuD family)
VLKRLFDLTASLALLILLAPIMLSVAAAVRFRLGAPVLFVQRRLGLNGKPFDLHKFRTMSEDRDKLGNLLPDGERLPAFGRWLRSTSLDELPQLFNVIMGDMSLVGPRPLLVHYGPLYSARQFRRHAVRPGITGLAQVRGRNRLSWEERFDLDVHYVDTHSLKSDLNILFLTCIAAFRRGDVSATGHATMEEFTGSPVPSEGSMLKSDKPVHAVFGTGGCGRDVMPHMRAAALKSGISDGRIIFVDEAKCAPVINGHRALSYADTLVQCNGPMWVNIAVADPETRQKLDAIILKDRHQLLNVKAETARIGDAVTFGPGYTLLDYVTITSNTRIGRCFLANNHAAVAHDCVIGDYVTFSPHACCNGHVQIGDRVFVGAGAIIRNGTAERPLRIGAGSLIAMGAVVIEDVGERQVVAGNPARPIRELAP